MWVKLFEINFKSIQTQTIDFHNSVNKPVFSAYAAILLFFFGRYTVSLRLAPQGILGRHFPLQFWLAIFAKRNEQLENFAPESQVCF